MSQRTKHNRVKFAINNTTGRVSIANSLRSDIDTDLSDNNQHWTDEYLDDSWLDEYRTVFENAVEPQTGELFQAREAVALMISASLAIIVSECNTEICDIKDFAEWYGIYNFQNERSKFRAKLDL